MTTYTGEPLLVQLGRACGLHGVYSPTSLVGRRADGEAPVPVAATVLVGTPVPVTPAPVDGVERVRAAARHPRVPHEVRVLVGQLTATAGQVLGRLDSLGSARRSGESAVYEALDAAVTALEVFRRLSVDCVDRPVEVPAGGTHLPVWGTTRTVREELVAQLDVLHRHLADVLAAVDAADIAALTGHGRTITARFGGEFCPAPDPELARVGPAGGLWSELAGVVYLIVAFAAIALLVVGAR
jgi:hypothetical protein